MRICGVAAVTGLGSILGAGRCVRKLLPLVPGRCQGQTLGLSSEEKDFPLLFPEEAVHVPVPHTAELG